MQRLAAALALLAPLALLGCTVGDASDGDGTDDGPGAPTADVAKPKDVSAKILRGVDRASAFSVDEAKVLAHDHGVKWTGVYLGGACDAGSGWTVARVKELHKATGWQFMPIWVGQQSSAICHAHDLTNARGKADAAETVKRMKEMGWEPNRDIPAALDLEAGTFDADPHDSASYVHGWVTAMHRAGYRAYVYGSPSGLIRFHDDNLGVDGGWVASYFYDEFKSVKPSDLGQIGKRYSHTNRAWQYAGDFEVSGVGHVDADTSDLLLAPAPRGTNRVATAKPRLAEVCGGLAGGEGLERGASIASCDGGTQLAMTADGDLQVTVGGAVTWSSGTGGVGVTAVLGTDGNLAVYDADLELVYDADTGGHPDAHAVLDATGMHVVGDDGAELRAF
jgi:hypothetical protein